MPSSTSQYQARIVILNYNGKELLPKCLPSIMQAAAKAKTRTAVTLLDNLSTDSSVDDARAAWGDRIDIHLAGENKILCSYNDYLEKMTEPVAILLNNDIRVDENFIDPLIGRFQDDPDTFLAAPKVMSFDGAEIEGAKTVGKMRWGLFWSSARYAGYEKESDIPSETFSSGFGAFSREKFLALGGYDPRYLPGIMEDADICLRASRKGYHLVYEPASVVYHMGQASFKKKFGAEGISILAHRNNFLFMWKNFSGFGFWLSHILLLPLRIVFSLLKGDRTLLLGFIRACQRARTL